MVGGQARYRSYLLRLWLAGNGDTPEWRMSLEDVITHERHSFAKLGTMFAFLELLLVADNRSEPYDSENVPDQH
jgi:hypothetical protein